MAKNFGFENNGQPAGSAANPGAQNNCDGPNPTRYVSAGHNLGGTHDCGLTRSSDQENVNPRLGQLQDNGGPTDTLALKPRSRAIDHASPMPLGSGVTACPKADQRGVKRPQGRRCDIGAFERKHHHRHHHHR
jgi:hypothetical protein